MIGGLRDKAKKYGPFLLAGLVLVSMINPDTHKQQVNASAATKRRKRKASSNESEEEHTEKNGKNGKNSKGKSKQELVQEKDKKNIIFARIRSLYWAARSSTLRNVLIFAASAALALRRFFQYRIAKTFPAIIAAAWIVIYRWRVIETPKVFFRRTYWNTYLVEKAKIATTEFQPVFWLFNRHAQTVTCFALSALEWLWARPILYKRETIPCHDEPNVQFIDWAYYEKEVDTSLPGHGAATYDDDPSAGHWETPIIICIHGLGDHKDIPYLKRFARSAMRNGWRVCAWSWWKFDLADSRDLKLVVDHIHQKYPRAPLVAIGWSAGAYPLVSYLEKAGADSPLVCAVCQSGCLDFVQAVEDVTTNENTTYPLFLLGQAHVCIRRHVRNDKRITDKAAFDSLMLEELHPMRLFNRFYTMLPEPIPDTTGGYARSGFVGQEGTIEERVQNAAHYVAPAIDHMDKIKVTTLIIHSEDDPIVSSEHVDWSKIENNRHIIVAHTHRGGHCAWHEGLLPFGDTWGDRVSCNFISSVMESHSQTLFIVELVRQAMSSAQFYARPSFSSPGSRRGSQDYDSNNVQSGGSFTPSTMARICSASDLAQISSPPLAVSNRDSVSVFRNGNSPPQF